MTNIVVLIKRVPWSERKLSDGDFTLDREAADAVLSTDQRARGRSAPDQEKEGGDSTVTLLCRSRAGRRSDPQGAVDGCRQAGAPSRSGLHGSDMVQTGWALARALEQARSRAPGLVIAGNEATDGTGSAVPAIIAEYLGLPQLTHLRKVTVEGSKITGGRRDRRRCVRHPGRRLPAIVSVNGEIQRAALPDPSKGHRGRERRRVTRSRAEPRSVLEVQRGRPGRHPARACCRPTPKPAETAGEKIADEGRFRRHEDRSSTWSPTRSSRRNPLDPLGPDLN